MDVKPESGHGVNIGMGCQQRVEAKAMRFSFSAFSKCLAILAVAVIAFTGETSRAQEVVPEARASLPDAIHWNRRPETGSSGPKP